MTSPPKARPLQRRHDLSSKSTSSTANKRSLSHRRGLYSKDTSFCRKARLDQGKYDHSNIGLTWSKQARHCKITHVLIYTPNSTTEGEIKRKREKESEKKLKWYRNMTQTLRFKLCGLSLTPENKHNQIWRRTSEYIFSEFSVTLPSFRWKRIH